MGKLFIGYGKPLKHISSVRQAHICGKSNFTHRYLYLLLVFLLPVVCLIHSLILDARWWSEIELCTASLSFTGNRVQSILGGERSWTVRHCLSSIVPVAGIHYQNQMCRFLLSFRSFYSAPLVRRIATQTYRCKFGEATLAKLVAEVPKEWGRIYRSGLTLLFRVQFCVWVYSNWVALCIWYACRE